MSEEQSRPTAWGTFSQRPNVIDAVQYVVVEKDGKKFNNFLKIIEKPHVNGRVYQDGEVIRVSSKNGRMQLRDGMWLVMTLLGEFEVYTDEQFQRLFVSGFSSSSEAETGGSGTTAQGEALLEHGKELTGIKADFISLQTAFTEAKAEGVELSKRTSEAEKEIAAISKQIAFMKKGTTSNVKSKAGKS